MPDRPDPDSAVPPSFGHPAARLGPADETADRILLIDHIVRADIGAFQPERGRPQRLRFNVAVEVDRRTQPDDDVDRILSYDLITEAIAAELAGERLNLLETLAERVAARVLAAPAARRVILRVEKLDLGPHAKGVEILRRRADLAAPAPLPPPPRPLVVRIDAAGAADPHLSRRLSDWEALGAPVVLCPGLPDLPRPVTGHAPTQRRIDLLAMEQLAWVLAARDPRCLVVAARTEIDWALRKGRTVVWAPGKMVLDAGEPPAATDPAVLAAWLARLLDARATLVHGADTAPADAAASVNAG